MKLSSVQTLLFSTDTISRSSDIRTFEDQPDNILHVGLVRAKPDVFIDEIRYLLVLSTGKSLILIGVAAVPITVPSSAVEPPRLDVKLYDTGFTYPAKEMQSIVGTQEGRVFMCGVEDGYLYELTYRSSEGWFSNKLNLICHSTAGGIAGILPVTLSSWRLVPTTDGEDLTVLKYYARSYPCQTVLYQSLWTMIDVICIHSLSDPIYQCSLSVQTATC